jgi:hypothetical protein
MSEIVDFRRSSDFTVEGVNKNGRFLGRSFYWKLYFVENVLRVVINTVLSIQVRPIPALYPSWWEFLYHDTKLMGDAERVRRRYLASPAHTHPGKHGIYYVYLHDLGNIMHENARYFTPIIPEVDKWVLKIEQVGLPRNCVGHMNLINAEDRRQINTMYYECKALIRKLEKVKVGPEKLVLQIPEV